ncbi:MAG: ATP/GTP-binding protein [Candidatus Asgardarchaeia archaeon]
MLKSRYLLTILGTAGSGKSTFTSAFKRKLSDEGYNLSCVNLDPGAEELFYRADWDVRDAFTVRDIMKKYGLGPNGAVIKSMELLNGRFDEYFRRIENLEGDYILVDTPGQLEVFAFRDVGKNIVGKFREKFITIGIYLIDAELLRDPIDLIVSRSLATSVELNLGIKIIPIVNKLDLIDEELLEMIYSEDSIREKVSSMEEGERIGLALDLLDLVERYSAAVRIVSVSSKLGEGLEDAFEIINESLCSCGDMT